MLTALFEVDDNGDGALSYRQTGNFTYGSDGELLEQVFETDEALPGGTVDGLDYVQSATLEYDARGNVVREVAHAQLTGFPPVTQITLQGYDSDGNLMSYRAEADFNGDGTIDVRISNVNTYNSRGQLLTSVGEVDSDGDGTIDQTSVVTTVYDGVKR